MRKAAKVLAALMMAYYLFAFERNSKKQQSVPVIDAAFILVMFATVVITIHYVAKT
jgi:hypothetical protein